MTILSTLSSRRAAGAAIFGLGLLLAAPVANAKAGGGFSSGSRGSRTFSAPAATPTAPRSAQPFQRTETAPSLGNPGSVAPGAVAQPRRFGFGTGLMAGLLGAGLFGMLGGHGFFGGLGGLASLFGLVFQIALIGGLAWLALRFFRSRTQPAFAGPGMARSPMNPAMDPTAAMRSGAIPGGGGTPPQRDQIGIAPDDYAAFERALMEVQTAYGREDLVALGRVATPEMTRYLGADLAENRARNLRNDVTQPKLLQGDLAEAWREGPTEYATVAMRFSIVDTMVDRVSGKVMSGNPNQPDEATELWTFRRDNRGPWLLSAVQQTG